MSNWTKRRLWTALGLVALTACNDGEEKVRARQKALDDAKAAKRAKQQEAPSNASAGAAMKLDAFWEDPTHVKLGNVDATCPEGLWALFPGKVPGEGAEKEANQAKRAELAKKLRETTFTVRLRGGMGVTVKDFNAAEMKIPVEVAGSIDCTDTLGRITIAWGNTKAVSRTDTPLPVNYWQSQPLGYPLEQKSSAEAKEFLAQHRFDIYTRLQVKVKDATTDRKMLPVPQVSETGDQVGERLEDWGAGRLVRMQVQAVRIAVDQEKTPVLENRNASEGPVKTAQGRVALNP